MTKAGSLDAVSSSLDPIPHHIRLWLKAVSALGFLSFFASLSLFSILLYRVVRWHIKAKRSSQFVILILNLVFADIQQSIAFLLNTEWLRLNKIAVGTRICWAQGWFVSTGDLASGVMCFAIGIHTLASVILNYRLSTRYFIATIVFLWAFVYTMALIGVGLHPYDLYVRAGAWCWVHHDFTLVRLWTHYFWIFVFEFGVVGTYATIFLILFQRLRTGYYSAAEADHVKAISKMMMVYPLVYIVCTLPLASSRMASMSNHNPSLGRLCFSACMITSNGWLDVLLYTFTRRIMIFSDVPPSESDGMDTFSTIWSSKRFGAATVIEATGRPRRSRSRAASLNGSTDDLFCVGAKDIKLVTTTAVVHEQAQDADFDEMGGGQHRLQSLTPEKRFSEESGRTGQLPHISD
ncbi:integral membrane protein-like protein [Lophium mytilinum]|uniref:Integral membrane protein-like protein n=1 Tax=Lophium mytilinum TaxID=390894 RepID=A0A6A6Q9Y1_9PEZI|nr:integral membrane protein-like protein [Lophium mytilinum]